MTATGRPFYPLDPRPDEVFIEDIAYSLSNQCRFSGHCKWYSVAEHSLRVSLVCDREDALWGLLHDASEAYLIDVPSPIKPYLIGYKEMEARVMGSILERFCVPQLKMPKSVHRADTVLLATEKRDLMPVAVDGCPPWTPLVEPLVSPIMPMCAEKAREEFLKRFGYLR